MALYLLFIYDPPLSSARAEGRPDAILHDKGETLSPRMPRLSGKGGAGVCCRGFVGGQGLQNPRITPPFFSFHGTVFIKNKQQVET